MSDISVICCVPAPSVAVNETVDHDCHPPVFGTLTEVHTLLADLAGKKLSDSEAQAVKARIFSEALSFTFDKQGRFGVTADLLGHAGIKGEAKLIGMGDTFNIMTPARWAKF